MVDRFTGLFPRWLRAWLGGAAVAEEMPPMCLAAGGLWGMRLRGPSRVFTCGEGEVWLTIEGDARDHVLRAGDSLRLPTGHVVVQALRATRFRVASSAPEPLLLTGVFTPPRPTK